MKKPFFAVIYLLFFVCSFAQSISQKMEKAYRQFEVDSQLRHAISSLYIINAKTGEVVFDRNSQVGLAPASTQKIVTAATAFELLGKNFRYKTEFIEQHRRLDIMGTGDPTLGSWRFSNTGETAVFDSVISKLRAKDILTIGDLRLYKTFDSKEIPSGWIYEDIGNYYGALTTDLNWHENQYNITFTPGKKVGDPAVISGVDSIYRYLFRTNMNVNECKTGPIGSGDNAYIYFIPNDRAILIQGTVPMGVDKFTISGADPNPVFSLGNAMVRYAALKGISILDVSVDDNFSKDDLFPKKNEYDPYSVISKAGLLYTHYSPSLDSIVYWFLQKSINLYGEALIKTFAYEKKGFGSTDSGVAIVKDFWKQKGLDDEELNIMDGSGLSPQNRVTTHAQVEILKYAKTREWFPYFYQALPTYNGMKMKSGSIRDVKGFCGYQRSTDGNEYIFSFLVNNYNGRSSMVVNKMYKVLDVLK
ncbi:MAG: D-alanyl-D-alanine carboxypeptidase/D-alanyl-D-alanine-endopeptidase [Bacteroidetes bacterium]|nr:MAG: D-alanyl-D-alanine carboxypeptidase/D-alanyl-D-alanine-endopeptidase [Bacteroidota bacterium]